MASVTVTTAGSPSGIAATASAMEVSSDLDQGLCRAQGPAAKITPTHDAGDHGQALAERVELHLQRRGPGFRLGEHAGQPPHLGGHAGGGDQQLRAVRA